MATLKSVLVKPLSAGKQKKKKNKNFTGAMLKKFIAGKHQECWEIATKIESRRRHLRKKRRARMRKLRAQPPRKREKITRTIYARAAGYAQDATVERSASCSRTEWRIHRVTRSISCVANTLRGVPKLRRLARSGLRLSVPATRIRVLRWNSRLSLQPTYRQNETLPSQLLFLTLSPQPTSLMLTRWWRRPCRSLSRATLF